MADGKRITKFLWQHYYNGRWAFYTEEESIALNRAVRNNQKTVILPHSSDKIISVDLIRMFQNNQMSKVKQEIRCFVRAGGFYTWEWMNDKEEYVSYPPGIVKLLEEAYQNGLKSLTINVPKEYKVDFVEFKKVDLESGYLHLVHREEIKKGRIPSPVLYYLMDNE